MPSATITGMDISSKAIADAKKLYPDIRFFNCDIRTLGNEILDKYNVVLLHQMLWYVLDDLELVLENCRNATCLNKPSIFLISQAFPREQRFGRNLFTGYEGAITYFKCLPNVRMVHSVYSDFSSFPHIDCHFALEFN